MCPGIDPRGMTYWEYTARLYEWNRRVREEVGSRGEAGDVAAPDAGKVRARMAALKDSPLTRARAN